jgi:hypothetical protein
MPANGFFLIDNLVEVLLPRGSGRRNAARRLKAFVMKGARKLNPDQSTHIFVACFQKSGSTYLTELLSEITEFPSKAMVHRYGHNEQDVNEHALEYFTYTNSVTQQHTKGTDNNVALLKKYNIKPVILVRNIFDVVTSLYDHIEKGRHRVPTGYVHKEYMSMSKDDKLLYIVRVHIPWYFNFLISWREAAQDIDVLWVTYEELFSNQVETASRVLRFYGLPVDKDRIRAAISELANKPTRIRFNVGISGRGESLSPKHKQAILDIATVWKVDRKDMQPIGIS